MNSTKQGLWVALAVYVGSALLTGLVAGRLAYTYWSWDGWTWSMAYPLGLFSFVCACLGVSYLALTEDAVPVPVAVVLGLLAFGAFLFLVFGWIVSLGS